ncbi:MAG TPA: hypothetical protein VL098_12640 [Flavipsychrobacter sp.]|nr:hypothetical protein [Flavipsychrobacter sp.]
MKRTNIIVFILLALLAVAVILLFVKQKQAAENTGNTGTGFVPLSAARLKELTTIKF